MADLSAYVDFSVHLDVNNVIVTDTSDYPGGVAPTITGIVSCTQPDGITRDGSFTSPDVYWDGSELTQAEFELRLSDDGKLQNGVYTLVYTVHATGYDPTIKTKSFLIDITYPTADITDLTDVFTPSLEERDDTDYDLDGFGTSTIERAWVALIRYVGTSIATVTGTAQLFDMAYGGYYYDANYSISLVSTVTYQMNGDYDWVTITIKVSGSSVIDAYTPPTLAELRALIEEMKRQIEAGTWCGNKCNCDCGSSDNSNCQCCGVDYSQWVLAMALYNLIVAKCQADEHDGLYDYVLQLLKVITCGVFSPTHTNTIIPPFDCGANFISCDAFGIGDLWITGADLVDGVYLNSGFAQFLKIFYNGGDRYLIEGDEWNYVYDGDGKTIGVHILVPASPTSADKYLISPNAFCDDSGGSSGGGGSANLGWVKIQFLVGQDSSVIPSGYAVMGEDDTVYIIPHGIAPHSEEILKDGVDVDQYPSPNFNYQIAYGGTSTTITFSLGVPLFSEFKIKFLRTS